jgi:Fe-S cluster assembly ATP-binding protein
MLLDITNLRASFQENEILKGINLTLKEGEVHALMGPNGSGKSTFVKVLAGHPHYKVEKGKIDFLGTDIIPLSPEQRCNAGVFLVFQQPREIQGIQFRQFLHTIHQEKILHDSKKSLKEARKDSVLRKKISPIVFRKDIQKKFSAIHLSSDFLKRSINDGFSGGEKKKSEILQMELLQPKLVLFDELDSGLDVDALKIVCNRIRSFQEKNKTGIILITHHSKILEHIPPNKVHLFREGAIQKSGDISLAREIDKEGYLKEY